jgi:hypothetical protein
VATLAHPTTGEFGNQSSGAGSIRAVLEGAVDAAPSHVRPPRGWLRRLFARDCSARALIERYGLWPAIEHAYGRVTHQYGPMRVEISAEDGWGDPYVRVLLYGDVPETDEVFEFESVVRHELWDLLRDSCHFRLSVFIRREYARGGSER